MSKKGERRVLNRLLFSRVLRQKNKSHKIAYIAVTTAFVVAANMLEIKFLDNQFSFTILIAMLSGCILGAGAGFAACVLGDFIGFLLHPAYIYMPWVGLSVGTFALITGGILEMPWGKMEKGERWVKLLLACFVSFFICTICINSTGFYFYNKAIGFSTAVVEYAAERFGGEGVTFFVYCAYRLIFKGQIWNSLLNYVLLLLVMPLLGRIKAFRGIFENEN